MIPTRFFSLSSTSPGQEKSAKEYENMEPNAMNHEANEIVQLLQKEKEGIGASADDGEIGGLKFLEETFEKGGVNDSVSCNDNGKAMEIVEEDPTLECSDEALLDGEGLGEDMDQFGSYNDAVQVTKMIESGEWQPSHSENSDDLELEHDCVQEHLHDPEAEPEHRSSHHARLMKEEQEEAKFFRDMKLLEEKRSEDGTTTNASLSQVDEAEAQTGKQSLGRIRGNGGGCEEAWPQEDENDFTLRDNDLFSEETMSVAGSARASSARAPSITGLGLPLNRTGHKRLTSGDKEFVLEDCLSEAYATSKARENAPKNQHDFNGWLLGDRDVEVCSQKSSPSRRRTVVGGGLSLSDKLSNGTPATNKNQIKKKTTSMDYADIEDILALPKTNNSPDAHGYKQPQRQHRTHQKHLHMHLADYCGFDTHDDHDGKHKQFNFKRSMAIALQNKKKRCDVVVTLLVGCALVLLTVIFFSGEVDGGRVVRSDNRQRLRQGERSIIALRQKPPKRETQKRAAYTQEWNGRENGQDNTYLIAQNLELQAELGMPEDDPSDVAAQRKPLLSMNSIQTTQNQNPVVPSDQGLPPWYHAYADLQQNYYDVNAEIPVFWHVPKSGGTTMADIFSNCLSLVTASQVGVTNGHAQDQSLQVWEHADGGRYVNVDTTSAQGIAAAKRLGFISKEQSPIPLANVIYTSLLFELSDLFPSPGSAAVRKGRIFALFTHPIRRAVSMYYHVRKVAANSNGGGPYGDAKLRTMTIEEYALSPYIENNWVTRFLTNKREGPLFDEDLLVAKAVLRAKVLVGTVDDFAASVKRFESYFGWRVENSPSVQQCQQRLFRDGDNRHQHAGVEEGSKAWELLMNQNMYDMMLYEYVLILFQEQAALVASSAS